MQLCLRIRGHRDNSVKRRQAPEAARAAAQRIRVDAHSLRYKTPPQRVNRIKGREIEEGKIGIAVAPGLSPPGRRYGSI